MYYSDEQTERELARLERSIRKEYTRAYKELRVKTAEYFENFAVRDAQMKKAIENGSYPIPTGYTPDQYYKLWRKNQLGRGKRWEKLRDDMAERIGRSNEIAAAYINDTTPGIYSLNYNYEAYQIEGITGASFDIYNEQTVKQIVKGENHIEFRTVSVDPVRDYAWNTKKINSALTSGILQGKSIKGLTDSFMTVMQNNRTAAIRNARTAVTSAQNGGRQESYNRASDMGIKIEKEWMAIIDGATRDSHMELDGVIVPHDETFPNGLMYPGDPAGAPKEVYNCRCTLTARLPKYSDYSLAKGSRTGNDVESYKEWLEEKNTKKSTDNRNENGTISKSDAESDLGKFKEKLRADETMQEQYYNALKQKYAQGNDDAKRLFSKYASGDTIKSSNYSGTANYNTITKKISMNYATDAANPRGIGATYFHEHGHLIDNALGCISDNKKFEQMLRDDALNYRKTYGKEHNLKTFAKVDIAISKELSDMRRHSAVSDIFGAVTRGNVQGCAGHDAKYFENCKSNVTAEAFAHMYEAQFDKTRYNEMKTYFPNALDYFEKTIHEAAK